MDKFFNLYLILFGNVILPGFYLAGDVHFRINVAKRGVFFAVKKSLLDPKNK